MKLKQSKCFPELDQYKQMILVFLLHVPKQKISNTVFFFVTKYIHIKSITVVLKPL